MNTDETTYAVVICDKCGAARLEIAGAEVSVSSSSNYPPCGCGGETFEQRKVVARRKMTVTWENH